MYPRVEYEMSERDLEELLDAMKPVPMIAIHIGGQTSPQERANRAWARLGKKMGFEPMTVQPIPGKGERFFTAVPSETETQRQEREAKEAQERRQKRIQELEAKIQQLGEELEAIRSEP